MPNRKRDSVEARKMRERAYVRRGAVSVGCVGPQLKLKTSVRMFRASKNSASGHGAQNLKAVNVMDSVRAVRAPSRGNHDARARGRASVRLAVGAVVENRRRRMGCLNAA